MTESADEQVRELTLLQFVYNYQLTKHHFKSPFNLGNSLLTLYVYLKDNAHFVSI